MSLNVKNVFRFACSVLFCESECIDLQHSCSLFARISHFVLSPHRTTKSLIRTPVRSHFLSTLDAARSFRAGTRDSKACVSVASASSSSLRSWDMAPAAPAVQSRRTRLCCSKSKCLAPSKPSRSGKRPRSFLLCLDSAWIHAVVTIHAHRLSNSELHRNSPKAFLRQAESDYWCRPASE